MKLASCLGGLAALMIALGPARGQAPFTTAAPVPPVATTPAVPASDNIQMPSLMPQPAQPTQPAGPTPHPEGISSWLAYPRSPSCCGPAGGHGPIFSEAYGRTGVAFALGTGAVGGQMRPGVTIGMGARTLFFNLACDRAWVVDFGVSSVWHNAVSNDQFTLVNTDRVVNIGGNQQRFRFASFNVIPDGMNQTYLNVSLGQELYLWGSATCEGTRCRAGWDLGGRYGSCRYDLIGERHRTDTVGGFFVAAHTDIEVPCGCCIVQAGGRVEYGYVWSDVLQSRNYADYQSLNILLTAGLRF